MAHIAPSAVIFSPSVARAAASAAKDWNYVDSWLSAKYHGRTPPAFERNSDTLRVLLALATANETADEERELVAQVEAAALQELRTRDAAAEERETLTHDDIRQNILDEVESMLSRDGKAALEAMAAAAVDLGIAMPEPETLGKQMVSLQAELFELEQTHDRVAGLQQYLDAENQRIAVLLGEIQKEEYRPAPELAKQNLEGQRRVKASAAKLAELQDKINSLAAAVGTPSPTIEEVRAEEEAYLDLLASKKDLDAEVKSFQGLSPDPDEARQELERLRAELRQITRRRDAVFEGLVERETPRKPNR